MTGPVALINDAGRGIADRLLTAGWQLSLGFRDQSQCKQGAAVQTLNSDAASGGEDHWVAAAVEQFGRVDAIVANADVMITASVAEVSDEDLDMMWTVNVRAAKRHNLAEIDEENPLANGRRRHPMFPDSGKTGRATPHPFYTKSGVFCPG